MHEWLTTSRCLMSINASCGIALCFRLLASGVRRSSACSMGPRTKPSAQLEINRVSSHSSQSRLYMLHMRTRHDVWKGERFHTCDVWKAPRGR